MANENTPDDHQPGPYPSPEPDPWATTPRRPVLPEGEEPSPFARPVPNPWGQASSDEPTTPTTPIPPADSGAPAPQGQPEPTTPYPIPEVRPYEPQPANPYAAEAGAPPVWAQQPQQQPAQPWVSGAYPAPPTASEPAPNGGGWAPYPGASGPKDANPLAALFDFSFARFATPGLVKIVYILVVVTAVGGWLLSVLGALGAGVLVGSAGGDGAVMVFVTLFFGWIPALLSIAFARFVLEGVVALIRIHDRVAEIADRTKDEPSA